MKQKRVYFYIFLASFIGFFIALSNVEVVQAGTVNDYIISNRIQPVKIQNKEGTFSHWTPYEHGVGKPEGVVIHETADDHATANAKYIQVELCHTHDYDSFARSIANDAYYVASKLIQYNLPDKPEVTIVSHDQVSKMYHETDHTDPVGYFNNWGYSMYQLYDMIGYYYNNLKTTGDVYGANRTKPTNPVTNSANTIKVDNTAGNFVPIVAFNNDGTTKRVMNRALANNSAWYTDQVKTSEGVVYHRVATNEWVAATYVI